MSLIYLNEDNIEKETSFSDADKDISFEANSLWLGNNVNTLGTLNFNIENFGMLTVTYE